MFGVAAVTVCNSYDMGVPWSSLSALLPLPFSLTQTLAFFYSIVWKLVFVVS